LQALKSCVSVYALLSVHELVALLLSSTPSHMGTYCVQEPRYTHTRCAAVLQQAVPRGASAAPCITPAASAPTVLRRCVEQHAILKGRGPSSGADCRVSGLNSLCTYSSRW
jgi:hypothetical protein